MTMNLPPEARSIIVGSLLGDAYLYPNGTLQIEHSLKQASYVEWKYRVVESIAGKAPTIVERHDSRTNRVYRSMRFYTKARLKSYRETFYRDRRKITPKDLDGLLDPMGLSVWFMDDGGRGARTPRGLVFNTSCYSQEEQVALQSILLDKFGVEVSIHTVGSGFQLYVRRSSFERFVSLVAPYIVPQMRYKLPIDPVTTSPLKGWDGDLVRERTIPYRHNTSALTSIREMKA